ncbi:hypothetical protein ATKI12_4606 [Kitasatospora sp. Ki12]
MGAADSVGGAAREATRRHRRWGRPGAHKVVANLLDTDQYCATSNKQCQDPLAKSRHPAHLREPVRHLAVRTRSAGRPLTLRDVRHQKADHFCVVLRNTDH